MADENNQGGFQKQMFQGEWTCSKCGGAINELPFQPNPEKSDNLQCRDCFRQNKGGFNQNRGGGGGFQKQTFQGNWTCSKCGGAITELPFNPDPARSNNLQCRNCFQPRNQSSNRDRY